MVQRSDCRTTCDQGIYSRGPLRRPLTDGLLRTEKPMKTRENGTADHDLVPTALSQNIDSVAIQRMIEEVRSEDALTTPTGYNRTYNRHNR